MVHQPAVEISIGDIFKTTQYLLGNRYTVIFYGIWRVTWYIGFLKDIELSYRYRRRRRAYLFRHGDKIFAQSQVGSKVKFSLNLYTNFGRNYVNSLNFKNKNDKLTLMSALNNCAQPITHYSSSQMAQIEHSYTTNTVSRSYSKSVLIDSTSGDIHSSGKARNIKGNHRKNDIIHHSYCNGSTTTILFMHIIS